jgi:uncharacterized membrane protein YgcG
MAPLTESIKTVDTMMTRSFAFLLFLFLISSCTQTSKENYVDDRADLLTSDEERTLESELRELENSVGSQMAILIIESLQGEKIADYSLRKANEMGLGRKDYNDGVLITVALQEKEIRIEIGKGLERIIPNQIADDIIYTFISPQFRQKKYFDGLLSGVVKLKTLVKTHQEAIKKRS